MHPRSIKDGLKYSQKYSQMLRRCECIHLFKTTPPNCNYVSKQEIASYRVCPIMFPL